MARTVGNYELLTPIGRGGMGEVWRARHQRLERDVAVKLIGGGASPDDRVVVERFLREGRVAATLRSPHAIRIHDLGVAEDGTFYQAMELLHGYDLQALVERTGPLPPGRVASLLRQACDALAEAHAHGLVHRDVKPSNLFLTRGGTQVDRLVVLDFGLARDATGQDALLTHAGVVPGSPAYLAPELIRGAAATAAADVYALGAVAWWLLTGRLVFEARSALELVVGHLEREPGPLPGVPDDLAAIVRACLGKDPASRPDARALSRSLASLATGFSEAEAEAWWDTHPPAAPDLPPLPQAPRADRPEPATKAPEPVLRQAREKAYADLRRHFEASRIDLGDMESRMARVGTATTEAAVRSVLEGLGPLELPVPVPVPPPAPATALEPRGAPPIVAVFGHASRSGAWTIQPTRAIAAFGGIDLDLREATLPEGITELRCVAAFGGITIIVPPELRVEVAGVGILGGFSSSAARPGEGPLLRITGVAVFGGVDVQVRARKKTHPLAQAAADVVTEVGTAVQEIVDAVGRRREDRKRR